MTASVQATILRTKYFSDGELHLFDLTREDSDYTRGLGENRADGRCTAEMVRMLCHPYGGVVAESMVTASCSSVVALAISTIRIYH